MIDLAKLCVLANILPPDCHFFTRIYPSYTKYYETMPPTRWKYQYPKFKRPLSITLIGSVSGNLHGYLSFLQLKPLQYNRLSCLPLTPVKCLFDKQLIFQRMKHWKKEKRGNFHLHQVLFLWKICSSHCFGRICSSVVCRIYVAALFGRMLNAARRLYEEA